MANPVAIVTAMASGTFSVTVSALSGVAGTTLKLDTRALGSAADWTTQASTASPAAGAVLTASGITDGAPLEWRVVETVGASLYDGTHGIVSTGSAIWSTLLSTVSTPLVGAGFTTYQGTQPPSNYPPDTAVLIQRPELERKSANNVALLEYPVEVELRIMKTSDTGELRTADIATFQRTLISNFDRKSAKDYPSIAGLELVTVEIRTKDDARGGQDAYSDETRARALVRFMIWEART